MRIGFVGQDWASEPFKVETRGDKLYGRGSADDGYAIYASIAASLRPHYPA